MTLKAWESLNRNEKRLVLVLKAHFDIPNCVWITGDWKTGKTDFALWLCEFLEKISGYFKNRIYLKNIASNIDTNGILKYIDNLQYLKDWLHGDTQTKLFLLDEVNKHLPSRRSMSKKSVGLIEVFPEVSKARGRLIVIGQNKRGVDKTLSDETWVKGTFYKVNLRTAVLVSPLLKRPFKIPNVPQTSIPFDPYMIAPFAIEPDLETLKGDFSQDEKLVYDWCLGKVTWKVKGHPQKWNRFLREQVLRLLKASRSPFTYSGGGIYEDTIKENSDVDPPRTDESHTILAQEVGVTRRE